MSEAVWKKDFTLDDLHRRNADTLSEHLGIVFTEIGDDYIKATMPVDERTCQPLKILHGGASCVLAETLASIAANCAIDNNYYCVGTEISASHVRSANSGLVTGITRPIRIGRSQQVWEIKIFAENGKQICISRMTATVRKRL